MPHKQKENHDHSAKSKKERRLAKERQLARKKAAAEAAAAAEEEAAKAGPNNLALVEGYGEYLIGHEPEKEIEYKVNVKKRSKKHLRQDMRKQERRKEEEEAREEAERLRRQEQGSESESSSEEEEEEEEYLIYICECCRKKFKTTNAFQNHSNSIKHRENASIFEEAGLLVTGLQWRDQQIEATLGGNQHVDPCQGDDDDDDESEEDEFREIPYDSDIEDYQWGDSDDELTDVEEAGDEEEEDEELEEEEVIPKAKNVFAAFAASSSSDDDSSEEEEENKDDKHEEEDRKMPARPRKRDAEDEEEEEEDEIDLDEIIQQNRVLASELEQQEGATPSPVARVTPLPFDDDAYDPNDYTPDENRLASVRHRLQKRLASKGIAPSNSGASNYSVEDGISVGRTLLQQVMEANIETLQQKLDAYNKHKAECQLLNRQFALARGNSKALAGQYVYRPDAADDARKRANVHHTGSHYHMQAARSMQFGRQKGLMARHSSQGARLQASRMAAKEIAKTQAGGKVRKTSKKSQQKRRGEAGGSKKSGGEGKSSDK